MDASAAYLADLPAQIDRAKQLADRAVAQLTTDEFFCVLDGESNSVAIIMQHVAGNLRSRFTDFLTSDGEKPDRHRDGEFEMPAGRTRESVQADWDNGFRLFSAAVTALEPGDLLRDVSIRGDRFSVVEALQRAITHVSYHVGQIVFLAKHLHSNNWHTLTIPRGQSDTFKPPR
jgi:hypothetical protein